MAFVFAGALRGGPPPASPAVGIDVVNVVDVEKKQEQALQQLLRDEKGSDRSLAISLGDLSPQQRRIFEDSERQRHVLKSQLLLGSSKKRRKREKQQNPAAVVVSPPPDPGRKTILPPTATTAELALEVGLGGLGACQHELPVLRLPVVSRAPKQKTDDEADGHRMAQAKLEENRHLEAMTTALGISLEELRSLEQEIGVQFEEPPRLHGQSADALEQTPASDKWWMTYKEYQQASAAGVARGLALTVERNTKSKRGVKKELRKALRSQAHHDRMAPADGVDLPHIPRRENVELLKHELERSMGHIGELTDAVVQGLLGVIDMCPITSPKLQFFVKRYAAMRLHRLLGEVCLSMRAASFERWRTAVRVHKRHQKLRSYLRFQGAARLLLAVNRAVTLRMSMRWRCWVDLVIQCRIRECSEQEAAAAVILQRSFRLYAARRMRRLMLSIEEERRRSRAATTITRVARGKLTRLRMHEIRIEMKQQKAGRTLTRVGRGMLGRQEARARRRRAAALFIAIAMQRLFRQQQGLSIMRALRRARLERDAAITIQAAYRGRKGRTFGQSLILRAKQELSVLVIQKQVRSWLFRSRLQRAIVGRQHRRKYETVAAVKIQALFRGHNVRTIHRARLEVHTRVRRREENSATLIQAQMRRYLAVVKVVSLIKKRDLNRIRDARAWHEIWDEDTQNWMYRNISTMEILWEPPTTGYKKHGGDLVLVTGDVVPDSSAGDAAAEDDEERKAAELAMQCSECCEKRATRGCEECGDKFCTACFVSLHSGGQRAKHTWVNIGPAECAECDVEAAIRYCVACDEPFCLRCWTRIHSNGRRAQHSYCSIAPDGTICSRSMQEDNESGGSGSDSVGASAGALVEMDMSSYQHEQFDQSLAVGAPQSPWAQYYDDNGYPYWYCATTGESTYEQPMTEASGSVAASAMESVITVETGDISNAGWRKYEDDSGQAYWHNSSTGESTYASPETSAMVMEENPWQEVVDGDTVYYYNSLTGQSQWEPPY